MAGDTTLKHLGSSPPRRDALRKVTGQEQYIQDIRVPGMLVGVGGGADGLVFAPRHFGWSRPRW